jgi:hypothetical protein
LEWPTLSASLGGGYKSVNRLLGDEGRLIGVELFVLDKVLKFNDAGADKGGGFWSERLILFGFALPFEEFRAGRHREEIGDPRDTRLVHALAAGVDRRARGAGESEACTAGAAGNSLLTVEPIVGVNGLDKSLAVSRVEVHAHLALGAVEAVPQRLFRTIARR